jgi:glycosyltransferase involved in cell wall biosynthesis
MTAVPTPSNPLPPPLRILHLTAGSDAGGLSRYTFDLCTAMHARGHHVAIAGERGAWHEMFRSAPFPWIDAPLKGGPLALLRARRILLEYLERNPADILHVHYRRPMLVARALQKRFNIPILYTLHLSHMPMSFGRQFVSDFGDHAHAASEDGRDWLLEVGIPPDRITVIPHGIDVEKFPLADHAGRRAAREALGIPTEARVAAYVGRLDYPKNENWLLDVALRMPALHLLVAGDGPNQPAFRARVARDQLESRVHLLGHRPALGVYHAADALLLPSLREGFSLVCAEAMCAGVPVLRTRTSGTRELIVENVTGRSVAIDHDAFVAAAVEFLSLDSAELRRMGAAGAALVRANFTFERQFADTLALYRRLAGAGKIST